jgi:uncharacterized protein (TIRG00374 family)
MAVMPSRLVIPRSFWTWLRVAVSLALLIVLLSGIGYEDVLAALERAILWPIVLSALMAVFTRLLVAYRWFVLVKKRSSGISFLLLLRLVFISGFLGLFMPGAVGVELVRVYALARLTGVALALSSVLIERLTALIALAAIVLLGFLIAPVGLPDAVGTSAAIAVGLLAVILVGLFSTRVRALSLAILRGRLLAKVRAHLMAFFHQVDAFRQARGLMAQLAILSVALQIVRVLEGMFLAVAFGINVELAYLFVIIPAGVLVSMLPISLGGLGVREALYVALFGAVGVAPAPAFALSFASFVLGAIVLLPGAALYALGGLTPGAKPRSG